MAVQAYFYDADGQDREIDLKDVRTKDLGKHRLLWLDVAKPSQPELQAVRKLLDLEPEALAGDSGKRLRLDNFGGYFRFSVHTAPAPYLHGLQDNQPAVENAKPSSSNESVQIEFVVAERWLLTIRQADVAYFERFREQDKAETLIGELTGQSLAASLLDWHLGEFFAAVGAIEASADRLDERVLQESATRSLLGRMVALRRRVSKLRESLVAQRDVFYGLSRPDFALANDSGALPYYEALVARFERAVDEVEQSRSVVIGSFELFTSRTSQQTNDLVKVLTFLTAIVGFCAAIAGLMGMNFKLAFFETGMKGFALISGGLVLVAVGSVLYARRRRWI